MVSGAGALDLGEEGETLVFVLSGRLDAETTGPLWDMAFAAVEERKPKQIAIDATRLEYCDGSGIALIVELQRRQGRPAELRGLLPELRSVLDLSPIQGVPPPVPRPKAASLPVDVGRRSWALFRDIRTQISFVGELLLDAARALKHPSTLRWGDVLRVADAAGANALPIISIMGFLIGLILAFESAIPLRRFGAQLYVADLVAMSVVRELGPLMTAILLAGRSGSAFAAEIGTMKVNEELDALTTMGLAPVRFLVLPRVLAAVVVTPLLTIYFSLVSLVGAAIVVISLGYPLTTYNNRVLGAISLTAILGGLLKSFVFGIIVAGIGCQRGLSTGVGPLSVGLSTTRAVVAGIFLTVAVDGVFAIIYYTLGI